MLTLHLSCSISHIKKIRFLKQRSKDKTEKIISRLWKVEGRRDKLNSATQSGTMKPVGDFF